MVAEDAESGERWKFVDEGVAEISGSDKQDFLILGKTEMHGLERWIYSYLGKKHLV